MLTHAIDGEDALDEVDELSAKLLDVYEVADTSELNVELMVDVVQLDELIVDSKLEDAEPCELVDEGPTDVVELISLSGIKLDEPLGSWTPGMDEVLNMLANEMKEVTDDVEISDVRLEVMLAENSLDTLILEVALKLEELLRTMLAVDVRDSLPVELLASIERASEELLDDGIEEVEVLGVEACVHELIEDLVKASVEPSAMCEVLLARMCACECGSSKSD
jgi:hypothetical protein